MVLVLDNLSYHRSLILSSDEEDDSLGMINDRQRYGDSMVSRFIQHDGSDQARPFPERRAPWKERGDVSIFSDA